MHIGKAYSVLIVPLFKSDILEELEVAKDVLNKWNKNCSNERNCFLFYTDYNAESNEKRICLEVASPKLPQSVISTFLVKAVITIEGQ